MGGSGAGLFGAERPAAFELTRGRSHGGLRDRRGRRARTTGDARPRPTPRTGSGPEIRRRLTRRGRERGRWAERRAAAARACTVGVIIRRVHDFEWPENCGRLPVPVVSSHTCEVRVPRGGPACEPGDSCAARPERGPRDPAHRQRALDGDAAGLTSGVRIVDRGGEELQMSAVRNANRGMTSGAARSPPSPIQLGIRQGTTGPCTVKST